MWFDGTRFEALRAARRLTLGSPATITRLTQSTNDDALSAARSGAPHGSLFITDEQQNGRGRRGRQWFAAAGSSLLFSVILRENMAPALLGSLSLVGGLALRGALAHLLPERERELAIRVKWPNDVWVNERKIAGVLAESQLQGMTCSAVVIGIGVNVGTQEFPAELAATATSVWLEGGPSDREALLVELLAALESYLGLLRREGIRALQPELTRFDALRGRQLRVEALSGEGAGIDEQGRLLLRVSASRVVAVNAGSVELIEPGRASRPIE